MKVKRLKRAKKILNFFHFKYQYAEPYAVLLDGTFCQAALQHQINIREQMPKYLDAAVELFTTKCVLAELERLGREVYGALKICQQFEVAKCPHKQTRTAADCMAHLVRRAKPKFLVASQDEQLLFQLRDAGGVPLLSIKFNTILMEKMEPPQLRILQADAFVTPLNVFATHLNAPCSSILLAREQQQARVYLVVGKVNGETVFFPVDRADCVSKFECETKEPITALTAGDLRNTGRNEVVTVSCNGLLQSLRFPRADAQREAPIPSRVFCQQVNANVCAAECFDIDGDGLNEFVVVMTDRVVRSYRFSAQNDCLVPQNKWEMPTQISGWAIGLKPDGENFAFLSQSCQSHYVRLDFGQTKNVQVVQSGVSDRKYATHLYIPPNPYAVRLMQSLVGKVVLVVEGDQEVDLFNPSGDFVCVTHARLQSGVHCVITIDPWGQLLIYAFTSRAHVTQPVARCSVLRDVDHICAFPGPSNYSLFLSLVNIYNKVAIYLIDLAHVVQLI